MTTEPLHPMIVHLPLALAVLMPLFTVGSVVAWWREWLPGNRVWLILFFLQAILLITGVAALRSGEAEEERVEPIVGEWALETHEEAAEVFVAGAGLVLCLFVLPLVLPGETLRRRAAAVLLVAPLIVAVLAVRTGEAGGELVYRHGAGSAYQVGKGGSPELDGELRGAHGEMTED